MAICKYCGKYNDRHEWPQMFVEAYTPDCCFNCYEENPDRAVWGHVDEEETNNESETVDSEPDLDDIIAPDPTDGECEDTSDPE